MIMSEMAIHAESLTKRFGNFTAVDNISFSVEKGEIFGFLGANGAGKTTAMRMLCGLSRPIGYMSQRFSLYDDLTVSENMTLFAGIYGMREKDIADKRAAVLTRLGLYEERDMLVGSLPLGWKQKLAFSVSIFHEPAVVFLDEPTGGVDPVTRRQFWRQIYEASERGITVFVTTHYMDEAEYCHRVSIMVDGRIAAMGTPSELKASLGTGTMDDVFYMLARNAERIG